MLKAWVKNVHNLRTVQGETLGKVSTHLLAFRAHASLLVKKPLVLPAVLHQFYPHLSTYQLLPTTPTDYRLYPQSTPPTINTKKEI